MIDSELMRDPNAVLAAVGVIGLAWTLFAAGFAFLGSLHDHRMTLHKMQNALDILRIPSREHLVSGLAESGYKFNVGTADDVEQLFETGSMILGGSVASAGTQIIYGGPRTPTRAPRSGKAKRPVPGEKT